MIPKFKWSAQESSITVRDDFLEISWQGELNHRWIVQFLWLCRTAGLRSCGAIFIGRGTKRSLSYAIASDQSFRSTIFAP